MTIWFINLVLVLCCVMPVSAAKSHAGASENHSRLFFAAVEAYKQNKYSDALAKFSLLSKKEADSPEVHYYLGLTYKALCQYESARKEFMWNYTNRQNEALAYKSWQALSVWQESKRSQEREPFQKETKKSVQAVLGDGWTYAKPGFGGTGKDSATLPSSWTWRKTSEGCGRH